VLYPCHVFSLTMNEEVVVAVEAILAYKGASGYRATTLHFTSPLDLKIDVCSIFVYTE
jgi:hypothetical protein